MADAREDKLRRAHRGLLRAAIIWTPPFLASAGGGVYFLVRQVATDDGAGWVAPIVLLIFAALLGFQSIQPLRDLRGRTVMLEGFVTRRWAKFDLIARSNYLRIDHDKILRTDRVQYLMVDKDDYVEIEYFPASMIAAVVEKKEPPEGLDIAPEGPEEAGLPEPDPLLIERD
ncbi:MAG: hypothetical protein OXG61_08695 [Chloroflexi bacterium]|nr:hypothetical protein [Chloroflexota bacterium]